MCDLLLWFIDLLRMLFPPEFQCIVWSGTDECATIGIE